MTINSFDDYDDYQRSLWDDGAGGLVDNATFQSRVHDDFGQMGTIYNDPSDVPITATVREAGRFSNPFDAMEYLNSGGLSATDDTGDLVPIGFVYLVEEYDDLLQAETFIVYIDEDTT